MFTLTLSLLVVVALSSLVLIRAIKTAPLGFEDATGFQFGAEDRAFLPAVSANRNPALSRPAEARPHSLRSLQPAS